MRLKLIEAVDVPPVKVFSADNLSDVVVLAGPNGVGKTRLVEHLLQFFRNPQPNGNLRLVIQATDDIERTAWGKDTLDTTDPADCNRLRNTLQANRKRNQWDGAILNFDSDRSIQQINPFQFSWDFQDPWKEQIGWDLG